MAKSVTKAWIDTPCIGVCSTIYGDEICRGCKRHYKEVIEWNTYDNVDKHDVYSRLSHIMSKTVSQFLIVTNQELLLQQLHQHSIRYHHTDDPLCWAHHLLRVCIKKINTLEQYGIQIKAEFTHLTLPALFTLIDETLYSESGLSINI